LAPSVFSLFPGDRYGPDNERHNPEKTDTNQTEQTTGIERGREVEETEKVAQKEEDRVRSTRKKERKERKMSP
jgi:hypothetical protein